MGLNKVRNMGKKKKKEWMKFSSFAQLPRADIVTQVLLAATKWLVGSGFFKKFII